MCILPFWHRCVELCSILSSTDFIGEEDVGICTGMSTLHREHQNISLHDRYLFLWELNFAIVFRPSAESMDLWIHLRSSVRNVRAHFPENPRIRIF